MQSIPRGEPGASGIAHPPPVGSRDQFDNSGQKETSILTALEVRGGINALIGRRRAESGPSINTTGCVTVVANRTLLEFFSLRFATRAGFEVSTHSIANLLRRQAFALSRFGRREGRESVLACESTWVTTRNRFMSGLLDAENPHSPLGAGRQGVVGERTGLMAR